MRKEGQSEREKRRKAEQEMIENGGWKKERGNGRDRRKKEGTEERKKEVEGMKERKEGMERGNYI